MQHLNICSLLSVQLKIDSVAWHTTISSNALIPSGTFFHTNQRMNYADHILPLSIQLILRKKVLLKKIHYNFVFTYLE